MTLELSEKGGEYGLHHFTDEKTGSTRIKKLVNWDSDPTSVPHTASPVPTRPGLYLWPLTLGFWQAPGSRRS